MRAVHAKACADSSFRAARLHAAAEPRHHSCAVASDGRQHPVMLVILASLNTALTGCACFAAPRLDCPWHCDRLQTEDW